MLRQGGRGHAAVGGVLQESAWPCQSGRGHVGEGVGLWKRVWPSLSAHGTAQWAYPGGSGRGFVFPDLNPAFPVSGHQTPSSQL